MDREFVVNGRYLAKYPDGRYSGEVGLCTHVKAPDKSAAVKQAMQKTIFFSRLCQHGMDCGGC